VFVLHTKIEFLAIYATVFLEYVFSKKTSDNEHNLFRREKRIWFYLQSGTIAEGSMNSHNRKDFSIPKSLIFGEALHFLHRASAIFNLHSLLNLICANLIQMGGLIKHLGNSKISEMYQEALGKGCTFPQEVTGFRCELAEHRNPPYSENLRHWGTLRAKRSKFRMIGYPIPKHCMEFFVKLSIFII